jgi:hypothetical protein
MQLNGNETDLPQLSDAQDYDDWGSKGIKVEYAMGKKKTNRIIIIIIIIIYCN